MASTLDVLQWAREQSANDEVVSMFWKALCEAVSEPSDASANRVFSEVRAYGGNTIVNMFRDSGPDYSEVAYDVATTMRGCFESAPLSEGDVVGSERFVLKKLNVSSDDVAAIRAAAQAAGVAAAVQRAVAKAVAADAARKGAAKAGKEVGKVVAREVGEAVLAEELAKAAAKKLATAMAKRAATAAARKAAEKAAQQAAAQVAQGIAFAFNVVGAVWTVVSIAGPAMRKTIPAVAYVGLLRQSHMGWVAGIEEA